MIMHIKARGVEVDDTFRCFIASCIHTTLGPWIELGTDVRITLLNADRARRGPVVCTIQLSIEGADYAADGCCVDKVSAVRRACAKIRRVLTTNQSAPGRALVAAEA